MFCVQLSQKTVVNNVLKCVLLSGCRLGVSCAVTENTVASVVPCQPRLQVVVPCQAAIITVLLEISYKYVSCIVTVLH